MKKYIDQFYSEGLATTLYLKPITYLKKKIKNEKLLKILSFIIKVLYTILVLGFAVFVFMKMI